MGELPPLQVVPYLGNMALFSPILHPSVIAVFCVLQKVFNLLFIQCCRTLQIDDNMIRNINALQVMWLRAVFGHHQKQKRREILLNPAPLLCTLPVFTGVSYWDTNFHFLHPLYADPVYSTEGDLSEEAFGQKFWCYWHYRRVRFCWVSDESMSLVKCNQQVFHFYIAAV